MSPALKVLLLCGVAASAALAHYDQVTFYTVFGLLLTVLIIAELAEE